MKLDAYRCDICENDFYDADRVYGLDFHSHGPGDFSLNHPTEFDKHICRGCLNRFKNDRDKNLVP